MMQMTVTAALLAALATGCWHNESTSGCAYAVNPLNPDGGTPEGFDAVGSYASADACGQYCTQGYSYTCQLVTANKIECLLGCE